MRSSLRSSTQQSDAERISQVVVPRLSVEESSVDFLSAELAEVEINSLFYTTEEITTDYYSVSAFTPDGALLGLFSVEETPRGCYAMVWGTSDADVPSPDPSGGILDRDD